MDLQVGQNIYFVHPLTCSIECSKVYKKVTKEFVDGRKLVEYTPESEEITIAFNSAFDTKENLIKHIQSE